MEANTRSLEVMVKTAVQSSRGKIGPLMPVLHELQEQLGYIPPEAVPLLADAMSLSRAEIHGVIAFYHDFRSEPPGRHVIHVCRAEACQAMGSGLLEEHIKGRLGVAFGETSENGRYSLEPAYCLGHCACSPSIRVGDSFHARVSPEKFDAVLAKLDGED